MEDKSKSQQNCTDLQLVLSLPVAIEVEPLSPKERIRLVQKRLQRASHSTLPWTRSLCDLSLGTLPPCLIALISKWRQSKGQRSGTSLLTVSSPIEKRILFNCEVVGIFPLERFPVPGLLGPSLLVNSYGGSVQFILSADSNILPQVLPLKDLNTFIFKELNDLIRIDPALYV